MRENNIVQCPHCLADNSEDSQVCTRCGSSLEDSLDTFTSPLLKRTTPEGFIYFAPGEVFADRYRIVEEIGRGGMGIVYKAEDQHLGIKVALKLIDPFYSGSSSMVQRFKKETLLTRSISHENVIRIHDIGQHDDVIFISMDYIEGQNLRQLVRVSGSLGTETATKITQQICMALVAAHKKGIIHRDLKSQNIMVDSEGHVYAMDFGLAKSMEGSLRGLLPRGRVMGTPAYMSPEQARGEDVDHRSDIYSLGIIMFELFAGARPFAAESKEEYIEKHINEAPALPSKVNPLIPDHINDVILKCLEKDKEKRFQSAQEILEALTPPLEREESEKLARSGFGKVLRYWFILPLIIAGAFGAYSLLKNKGTDEKLVYPLFEELGRKSIAIVVFENNTGDESLNHLGRALQNWLIYDLGQSKYFKILADDKLNQVLDDEKTTDSRQYSTETLGKISEMASVKYFILGSYTKTGDSYWITIKIREIGKSELLGMVQLDAATEADLHQTVDIATNRIKEQFMLTEDMILADRDEEVGVFTTSDPEAWKYFNYAVKLGPERKYEEAITYYKRAIEIDPEFAIAYKRMAEAYRRIDDVDKFRESLLKAVEFSHRASDRDKFLIKAAVSFFLENSIPQAIEDYKEMLQIFPDDEEANNYLGATYRFIEEWDLALPYFEKSLKSSTLLDRAVALDNVVYIYTAKGWYDQAEEIMKVNEHFFSNKAFYHRYMSNIYLCQNKCDLALKEVRKALKIEPDNPVNHRRLGQVQLLMGDFKSANSTYSDLINKEDERSKSEGIYRQVFVYLTRGRFEDCLSQIDKGLKLALKPTLALQRINYYLTLIQINLRLKRIEQAWEASHKLYEAAVESEYDNAKMFALLMRGSIQVEMEKLADAKGTAVQLRKLSDKVGIPKHFRYYHLLQGKIFWKEGMQKQAVNELETAVSFLPHQNHPSDNHAMFLEELAIAHYQMQNLENAAEVYRQISLLTAGRVSLGDVYALSFYWLGKIHHENRQINQAKDSYRFFLKLWEKSDPGLEWVEDAKKQLQILESGL